MLTLKKNYNLKQTEQFLNDQYDELNWGETLDEFVNENLKLINNYKGCLINIMNEKETIGGFILYEHENKKFIGCAIIFQNHRGHSYFKQILDFLNEEYAHLYFFCQEKLLRYYRRFHYLVYKEIEFNDEKVYLFTNSNNFNLNKIIIF